MAVRRKPAIPAELSPEPPFAPPPDGDEEQDQLTDESIGKVLDDLPALEPEDESDTNDLPLHDDFDLHSEEEDSSTEREPHEIDVGADTDDLSLPGESERDDDAEGVDDNLSVLDELSDGSALADDSEGLETAETELPGLPALDRGDDAEGALDRGFASELVLFDEERPRASKRPLVELEVTLTLESCTALASSEDTTVAASTDLFWFGRSELTPVRLEAGSSRIHALALVGSEAEYAVCATTSGKLLRRGRLASASEELRRLRDLGDGAGGVREVTTLCQPGRHFPHTVLVLSSNGKLLRSDDDGLSFRRVTERKIVAISRSGPPVFALSATGSLLQSDDGGGGFRELPFSELGQQALVNAPPLLASGGGVLALASAELGVWVAESSGAPFRRVAGTRGVTALCIAESNLESAPFAFAAIHDEAHDRSFILRIDCSNASAELVHRVDSADSDDSEEADLSRVLALTWDVPNGRLWAAGAFGVKAFVHPLH